MDILLSCSPLTAWRRATYEDYSATVSLAWSWAYLRGYTDISLSCSRPGDGPSTRITFYPDLLFLAWSCATYEDYTATVLWPGSGLFYEEILTVLGLEVGHLRGYTAILFLAWRWAVYEDNLLYLLLFSAWIWATYVDTLWIHR